MRHVMYVKKALTFSSATAFTSLSQHASSSPYSSSDTHRSCAFSLCSGNASSAVSFTVSMPPRLGSPSAIASWWHSSGFATALGLLTQAVRHFWIRSMARSLYCTRMPRIISTFSGEQRSVWLSLVVVPSSGSTIRLRRSNSTASAMCESIVMT